MGQDKRRLLWDGVPLLDRVSAEMRSLFSEVLVVTAKPDYDCSHLPVRQVHDSILGKGSLGGLYTGLQESRSSVVFVVACDMPFLLKECIARMCSFPDADVVIAKLLSGLQPLHACYSKRSIPVMERMIESGNLRIQDLAVEPTLSVKIMDASVFDDIDPCRKSFVNVNSPADLALARKAISGSTKP